MASKAKDKDKQIGEALLKVALGFQVAEVTEEYAEVDGTMKLTKRRRTKKDVPPDLKAVQLLLAEAGGTGYASMTDEELEAEKARLLADIKTQAGEKKPNAPTKTAGSGQAKTKKKNGEVK